MTKQEFMEEAGAGPSDFSGNYYIYTGIPGQSVGELKYFYGCPINFINAGMTKDDLLEKMFDSFLSEYPDGIEDVVVVDMGKVSLKGGVLTCIDFTDTTISSITNP